MYRFIFVLWKERQGFLFTGVFSLEEKKAAFQSVEKWDGKLGDF